MAITQARKGAKRSTHTGHESVLNALCKSGKGICITMVSGNNLCGNVKAFDKYTISVQQATGEVSVVFKSAIESFTAA